MEHQKIIVLDFGSQYAHLIAKRFRLLGFYSEIAMPSAPLSAFDGAMGVVMSGGPSSVYETNLPTFNEEILGLPVPILGLCYGHQLMAQCYGGTVEKARVGEFGISSLGAPADRAANERNSPLFEGLTLPTQVWMSHQDEVTAPPPGFEVIASTKDCRYAALQNLAKKRWSLQCHVEVKDTPEGDKILANFAKICGMEKNWSQDRVLDLILDHIRDSADGKPHESGDTHAGPGDGKARKVLLFLSGGVDSTVAFALLNKALGQDRVLGLHIDNGFMRKQESAIIAERYRDAGFTNFIVEDASETFLKAVYHEADPQKKRKAIGETFITVRDTVVKRIGLDESEWLLAQGTLYPDIIESGGTKNSHVIKTHHNRVEGIQALIEKGLIVEPLKDLYKDEVRVIGKKIGLADGLVYRHPFPGPGLSINVLASPGQAGPDAAKDRQEFDQTLSALAGIDLSTEFGAASKPGKTASLPTLGALPVRSVGVQGDFRTYRFPAVLSFPGLWKDFPSWESVEAASSRITNTVKEVNRTVLELWRRTDPAGKPVRLELRELWCDRPRLDQTREVDAIVLDELKMAGLYRAIFQHLTINLPCAAEEGHCAIVLRPVVSEDVMTARFAHLDLAVLQRMVDRIKELRFVDALFYDVTNKPPATFGWE